MVADIEELAAFSQGDSFSEIHEKGKEAYTYVQAHMEDYGFTCLTMTLISDYFLQLTAVQQRFVSICILMLLVTLIVAFIYSVKLVKPLQDIKYLLDSPNEWQADDKRYSDDMREIANQIVTHL